MDSDQLFELFDQALDLEAEEREAFLKSQDPDVTAELRKRIASYEEECGFFDKNLVREYAPMLDEAEVKASLEADDPSNPTLIKPLHAYQPFPETEEPTLPNLQPRSLEPQNIGPYPIIKKIGQGGMGSVYLVRQMNPEREVALKLINHARVAPEFLARFEAEFGVLGLMNHNNIARIYYSSTTAEGDPYFTMEYVDGMPISKYCREHNLSVRRRLELFGQVCEGVFHAHQKAVVHRDLKPSNILITVDTDRPVAKLIDFGIAKGLDDSLRERTFETRTGVFVGTLDYMSPEQMGAGDEKVDTRSDIYSLGVLLYELLTGLLPFDKAIFQSMSVDQMLRFYREEDPPRPSLRLKEGKDAAERTLTTQVTDVKSFLHQLHGDLDWIVMKALEKDPDRRYQTVAAFKSDVVNYLNDKEISARPPSMTYRVQKFTRRNRILVAAALLTFLAMIMGVATAVSSHFKTKEALHRYRATNDFLIAMLKEPDPQKAGVNARVVDVLANAEDAMTEGLPDKELEATMRRTLGNTYWGLGDYDKALELLQRSYDLCREFYGDKHPETLETRYYLGRALRRAGNVEASISHMEMTWEIQKEVLGAHHRKTLRSLYGLANAYFANRDYKRSKEVYEAVWHLQTRALGEKDPDTAKTSVGLANCYGKLQDFATSLKWHQRALSIHTEISGETSPTTLGIMNNVAICYRNIGELDKAVLLLRKVVVVYTKLMGSDHPRTISASYSLAQALNDHEKYAEAELLASRVLEHRRARLDPHDQKNQNAMKLLGQILGNNGKLEQAISLLRELEAQCETMTDLPSIWFTSQFQLGLILQKAGKTGDAVKVFERLHLKVKSKHGSLHHDSLETLAYLGAAYQKADFHVLAEEAFLNLAQKIEMGTPTDQIPSFIFILTDGLRDTGHYLQAENILVDQYHIARLSGHAMEMEKLGFSLETLYKSWQGSHGTP